MANKKAVRKAGVVIAKKVVKAAITSGRHKENGRKFLANVTGVNNTKGKKRR